MPEINGQQSGALNELEELAEMAQRDAERIANRSTTVVVQEWPEPSSQPFDQAAHDLMLKSIDQVAADWVSELTHARDDFHATEQLVLQCVAKVKTNLTQLYLIGNFARASRQREVEANIKMVSELDKLMESHAA